MLYFQNERRSTAWSSYTTTTTTDPNQSFQRFVCNQRRNINATDYRTEMDQGEL
jgi:hypothetical protein